MPLNEQHIVTPSKWQMNKWLKTVLKGGADWDIEGTYTALNNFKQTMRTLLLIFAVLSAAQARDDKSVWT